MLNINHLFAPTEVVTSFADTNTNNSIQYYLIAHSLLDSKYCNV